MHPVLALFRRNEWATGELLRFCAGRPPEVLQHTDPDVYGTIEAQFKHIVGAEQRYLSRLDGGEPTLADDAEVGLADLLDGNRECARRWEALLASDVQPDRVQEHRRRDGERFRIADWLGFVQAVHHGDDHRAQVNTLLSRQGIEAPNLDGWAFGRQAEQPGDVSAGARALLERFFGHHLWATDQQLRWFVALDDAGRAATAPGTYGSIDGTLTHLVMSDRTYLARLRRHDWPGYEGDFEASVPRRGGVVPAWVIAMQALHHGNDHRTHVGTVALANGLAGVPDVDVWSYAVAEGGYSEL